MNAQTDPKPETLIPESPKAFDGTRDAEDFAALGESYIRNYIKPYGKLEPHHAILDIGAGNGKLARALTGFLSPQGRYCGFDVMREVMEWCTQQYVGFPNFRFTHADIYSDHYNPNTAVKSEDYVFPYEDSSFDVAFAGSLFTHILPATTQNYLNETARVLKPGGRLVMTCAIVNEHNNGVPSETAIRQRRYTRASPVHHVLDPDQPSRAVAYDESALRRMVAASGMIVSTMLFGTWANGQAVVAGFQDCIITLKPR
jgi:SAM-dependent methyltransferase